MLLPALTFLAASFDLASFVFFFLPGAMRRYRDSPGSQFLASQQHSLSAALMLQVKIKVGKSKKRPKKAG